MKILRPIVFVAAMAVGARALQSQGQTAPGRADVTIKVPVQFASLNPVVSKVRVHCEMRMLADLSRVRSNGEVVAAVSNNAFSGIVEIKLTLSVAAAGEQWSYECTSNLWNSVENNWDYDPTTRDYHSSAWAEPLAGTQSTRAVSGTITVK